MEAINQPGDYTNRIVTSVPADMTSEVARRFKASLPRFPEEAIYIYSFVEAKMIYADGWEELLGYKDEEVNLRGILQLTTPEYAPFTREFNDKALQFMQTKTKELEKYSFTIEVKKIHKNGAHIPLIERVGVFRSQHGKFAEIIGRYQLNRNIRLGNIMYYEAYGPEKAKFEEALNKALFSQYAISKKEKEALALVANGYSFKEIAAHFDVTPSAIEKRILPMYRRFDVKSLSHLISFAFENHILP